MKVDFTGRGVDITDRVRSFTQGKLERLRKHLDEINDVHVVLSVEKYRHKAEIKFQTSKRSFHGAEETSEMFQSIDRVIDKLESQARKYKEKMNSRKRNTTESIRINVLSQPEPTDKGERELKVIHTDQSQVKPMSLEEAVDELEKLNQEFIIYRNSETDRINVVYHRKDGNVGYIEPGN
jgi:putative sigma-54 modulation protein